MHVSPLLLLTTLTSLSLVTAHGKVAVVQGDAGGNGTALGIIGGIVPGYGPNDQTEVDTTVFKRVRIATDGLGETTRDGENKAGCLSETMVQSGNVLPQVSADNGSISGTFHIVTTDGAGPISAIIDTGATGKFSQGVEATVLTDVPGKKGNIKTNGEVPRSLSTLSLFKRGAENVNRDFPFQIQVPAGTNCTGSVAGQKNVCFMKIANKNKAGPFGGVIAFQITSSNGSVQASVIKKAKRFSS
ncbi:hypothetical protein K491DRAFT_667854 [Lophiostoma macrostomum CBS 122681]|uniref:Cell surface protein n=1 Tax=Lophiostoma macrostomum CBS 122681 TaxID=1314788 RepID=A0A6A6SSU2_9PLEO|nr:hypothetical protein K491DRAFT_667854 [Lophiostoma macrostomum CBS 122681]